MPAETIAAPTMPTDNTPVISKPAITDKPAAIAKPPVEAPEKGKSFADEIEELAKGNDVNKTEKFKTDAEKLQAEKDEAELEDADKTPKPDTTKPDDKKPKSHVAILKENHEALKVKHAAAVKELEQFKKAKPAEDADKPILVKRLSELEKRNQELEETIKFTNFEQSDEYKQQYIARYEKVSADATNRAIQYKVPADDGTSRNLTKDEFWTIVGIGNENDAVEYAEKLFGENNPRISQVIERRNEILNEHRRGETAKEEYRSKGAERHKLESEKTATARAQEEAQKTEISQNFRKLNQERMDSKPEFYKAEEGDEQASKLINMSNALADLGFGIISDEQVQYLPEDVRSKLVNGRLPRDEETRLHVAMRSAMAERPVILLKYNRLATKVKELEASLSEYEESKPKNGVTTRRGKTDAPISMEQEIEQIAAGNTGRRR